MSKDSYINDDEALAAEYVLSLLDGNDLARAQQKVKEDKNFARLVTNWERHFASLTHDLKPENPKPETKKILEKRLFGKEPSSGFWQKIWVWQGIAAFCFLGFIAVGIINLNQQETRNRSLYTAEIISEAKDFRVVVVVDKSANEVILTKTAGQAPEGRILQVWAHGPNAPAISVGLWPEGDTVRLSMPPVIAAVEGVLTVGVSEEPPGGSPTGSPSGRVFGTVDIAHVVGAI